MEKEYLSISLDAAQMLFLATRAAATGEKKISIAAYTPDEKSENPQAPKYKSKYCAVWKGTMKPKEEEVKE